MLCPLLKSNVRRVAVTTYELNHKGVGEVRLRARGIYANEQGCGWNTTNGVRLVPYAVSAARSRRIIPATDSANPRASLSNLFTHDLFTRQDAFIVAAFAPQLVFKTPGNNIAGQRSTMSAQQS